MNCLPCHLPQSPNDKSGNKGPADVRLEARRGPPGRGSRDHLRAKWPIQSWDDLGPEHPVFPLHPFISVIIR